MKQRSRTFGTIGLLALLALVSFPAIAMADATNYGDGVSIEKPTPIKAILANPDAYVGKRVRIEGGVLDVCPAKGCWMSVGTEEANLRVKVEDDVIVFPADAKGQVAAAEGVVEAIDMTRDAYVAWLAHLAEEKGETFDAASVGKGPFRRIQIKGAGATIEAP